MKRDVNQVLLGLLLLVCVGIVGIVTYYNLTYENLNEKYTKSLDELENKSKILNQTLFEAEAKKAEVQEKDALLSKYLEEINLTRSRESSLGGQFQEVAQEKEVIESELSKTEQEKDQWINSYNKARDEVDVCTADLRVKTNKIGGMEDDIDEQAKNLDTKASVMSYSLDEIISYMYDMNSSIQSLRLTINDVTNDSVRSELREYYDDLNADHEDAFEEVLNIEEDIGHIEKYITELRNI